MRVSVIIPCYQAGAYLGDCLSSVLSQDFDGFEVICVNDGSTDGTVDILRVAAQDRRVHIYTTENRGASAARAEGLAHARGDYVLFVDADDLLAEGALQALYDAACGQRADIVSADHMLLRPDGTKCRETLPTVGESSGEILRALVRLEGLYNNQCNKLIYRALFTENAIAPVEGVRLGEDVLLNLMLYHAARGAAHLPQVTYFYRKHEASATARLSLPYDDHVPMLDKMREWLIASGRWTALWPEYLYTVMWLLQKQFGIRGALARYGKAVYPDVKAAPRGMKGTGRAWLLVRLHLFRLWYFAVFLVRRLRGKNLRQLAE